MTQINKIPIGCVTLFEKDYKNGPTLALGLKLYREEMPNIFRTIEKGTLKIPKNETAINNTEYVAISTSDVIFNFISINDFKSIGNKILNKVTIVLFDPPQKITDMNQIQQIIRDNHNLLTGGHTGFTRLTRKN